MPVPATTGAAMPKRRRSSASSRRRTAQHGVDVDEIVGDGRRHHILRHVARGAEEAARRYRGEELAVTIHEMGNTHHRGLRFTGAGARVARQAFVAVDVDLITLDG